MTGRASTDPQLARRNHHLSAKPRSRLEQSDVTSLGHVFRPVPFVP
jgi:hypothetical protein